MVRRLVLVWLVVSTVATLPAQQNTGAPVVPEQAIAPPPPLPPVTAKDLLDGLKNPARWLTYSGDYTGRRHSPLTQITPANVPRLASQWTFQAEGMVVGRGFEGTPLMMDGVLYITGNNNIAWAIDARTGRQIWRYRRPLPPALTYGGGNPSNRGFAALGDRLFMGTLDAHLLALDRDTGRVVWDTVVDDYKVGHAAHRRAARRQGQGDRRQLGRRHPDARLHRRLRCRRPARASGASTRSPARASRAARRGPTTDVLPRGGGATWVTGSYDPELESDLLGHRQSEPRLLRRRSPGRQPLHRLARRARRRHRQAAVALPVHAARPARLGLEPRAGARRRDDRRPGAQGRDGRQPQRLLLHARSRDRRAAGRQAVHRHQVGARDRQGRQADRAERRRRAARRLRGDHAVRARLPRRHGLQPAVVRPGAAAVLRDGARDVRLLHAAEAGAASRAASFMSGGMRKLAEPDFSALRAIDPEDRRDQVGAQVPDLVARRRDVHGVGPGVRRRQRRRTSTPSTRKSGKRLWSYRTGSPIWGAAAMTYMLDGRQYVLIESGNTIMAFALPEK